MRSVEVAGTSVRAGRRIDLELPVARLPSGTGLSLPLSVVHGTRDGPRCFLSAAIHGDELNGMEIIRQVLAGLDARTLAGTVVAAPIVNVFGFLNESRYLPDRRDLNRSFPGSRTGSLAARLAHLFMREVATPSDAGIDLHTGSDDRFNLPQVRANLHDPRIERLATAFGAPVVVHSAERDGSLRQSCNEQGTPVVVFEGGQAGRFDEDVIDVGVTGVRRLLAALGLIEVDDEPQPSLRTEHSRWVRARRSGIFRSSARPGDEVVRGGQLGVIADVFGQSRARVRAPLDGVVIGMTMHPSVNQGDALFHIARTG